MTDRRPILIAHRGNLDGRQPDSENHPDYLNRAISDGFDAEADLWKIGDRLFLGHDKPRHEVDREFLLRKAARLWIHAKDLAALEEFARDERFNVFCHRDDPRTLTTRGFVWTRSFDEDYDSHSIVLQLPFVDLVGTGFGGLCTNHPRRYREILG